MGFSRRVKVLFSLAAATAAFGAYAQSGGAQSGDAQSGSELPAWLEARSGDLTPEQREFLVEALDGGENRGLARNLQTKNAQQIAAYVEGMMTIMQESKFNPATDPASIPLNTEAEDFNAWKVKRPRGMDTYREPGPINLSYYASRWSGGIATFANAPVAVYPEDLVAGNVDIAIVGAPLNMGSGMRGAETGPAQMRVQSGMSGPDMATMVDPSAELMIVDYGDIAVDNMSTELTVQHVRERVAEIAATGAIPFIIGGDHSLAYPDIAGLADVHGKQSFGVVHFDAHYDAGRHSQHYIDHGAPVYRVVKEGHVDPRNYVQIGLRGSWPGAEGFEWMRNNGMRYHTMAEVEKKGWDRVMADALAEAKGDGKPIFISFDIDVLDPAFVPGTGTPVPGGLTMREAVPIVRRLCAENEMVGFEIVEVAPLLDTTYRTALYANYIVHACLTGIAMRKRGITEAGYLSDLTTEHRQPGAGRGSAPEDREQIDPNYGALRREQFD